MAKTLNELAGDLKAYIIELQSDAHNKGNLRPERYNNLKVQFNMGSNPTKHVEVVIGISSAMFSLSSGDKLSGGLGPDERYVIRWLQKSSVVEELKENWNTALRNRGRATDK